MKKLKTPIFKNYKNAAIAASAFWNVTPIDNNDLPIARYAPFDSYQLTNTSASNITVALNGSSDKMVTIYAGCGVNMTGHKFEWLKIVNLDAVNAIAQDLIDIEIGIGLEQTIGEVT